jgi:alkaline phosphatase D
MPDGIQAGDVTSERGLVWSRSDRPARLRVEWATDERFSDARTVRGPAALEESAFTAAVDLTDLPPGEQVFYRVRFESLAHPGTFSEPLVGRFRTAPAPGTRPDRRFRLAWSGDQVGQGWGIDPDRGGMRIFGALRRAEPDVFVHSGDMIYADQPLEPEVELDDGTVWRNVVTEAKSRLAETLDDFRGNFAYNRMDEAQRRFSASVPIVAQWDDHEVRNNWFPGLQLEDGRYTEKSASLLAARARRAFLEFVPIRRGPAAPERIYRHRAYGDLLDLFVLDLRSYRGPNTPNRQSEPGPETPLMGRAQLDWLKDALRASRGSWKVIASDLPIGLIVPDRPRDGQRTYEAWANADDGRPLGRELELAELLRFLKREGIRNTVWITADVHYAAAHHYSPERAAFADFDPFWELVAGPMHAGTFGPNELDRTFGPEVRFSAVGDGVEPNRPPSAGLQFFGTLDVDPETRVLTAAIRDVEGRRLWDKELPPAED